MFCVKKKGDIHQAAASTMLNDTLHHKLQSHNMNTITIQARVHSRLKSHLLQTNWFQPQDVASLSCVCTKAHLGLMWAAFGMYRSIIQHGGCSVVEKWPKCYCTHGIRSIHRALVAKLRQMLRATCRSKKMADVPYLC